MYYSDKFIDSKSNDQLGRGGFAALLAQSLLNLNMQDTFTVGLFGKWDSGKTSIVNMMLNEIEEQQKDCQKAKNSLLYILNRGTFLIPTSFCHSFLSDYPVNSEAGAISV